MTNPGNPHSEEQSERSTMSEREGEWTPSHYEQLVATICSDIASAFFSEGQEPGRHSINIYQQKKYLGKSGHHHSIDVSVEFELVGLKFIVLIECKHYKRRVGIDDLLEFAARLDDVGAHKGIVVTPMGFQEGAIKTAQAKGIALVKFNHEGFAVSSVASLGTGEIPPGLSESEIRRFWKKQHGASRGRLGIRAKTCHFSPIYPASVTFLSLSGPGSSSMSSTYCPNRRMCSVW